MAGWKESLNERSFAIIFIFAIVIFSTVEKLWDSPIFQLNSLKRTRFEECVQKGPYKFQKQIPRAAGDKEILSLVQALRAPSGLAALCDWVIGSRLEHWGRLPPFTAWGSLEAIPRTVFIQTDELEDFTLHLLPCFPHNNTRVALITGDHDKTTPRQIDSRYEGNFFSTNIDHKWKSWLRDSRIAHIFVEHLDVPQSAKVTAIPLGLNPVEFDYISRRFSHPDKFFTSDLLFKDAETITNIKARPLRALESSRHREGAQFRERSHVRALCRENDWCDSYEINTADYLFALQNYSFVLCAHGGGIDPNPKLFMALLSGTIPIIRNWPAANMYDGWPVIRVDDWREITHFKLITWRQALAPMFENRTMRGKVLERLTMKYWWIRINETLHG